MGAGSQGIAAAAAGVVYADDTLRHVAYAMAESGVTEMAVIARDNPAMVLGSISLEQLLQGRLRDLHEESHSERVLHPLDLIGFCRRVGGGCRASNGGDEPSRLQALLGFRTALRRFLHWSEEQARASGLTPAQHQLLLAVKGHDAPSGPTIGEIAAYLALRHHSAVELVDRAQGAGLVKRSRDRDDHRVIRLFLTASGEEHIRRLSALHLAELGQLALLTPPTP